MKAKLFFLPCLWAYSVSAQEGTTLPVWSAALEVNAGEDWAIHRPSRSAAVYQSSDKRFIILCNGLVKREFVISPNVACVDYKNLTSGQQLLRAIKPEARVTVDGKTYNVGGLSGQKENAYFLKSWLPGLTSEKSDFRFVRFAVMDIVPFLRWKANTWTANPKQATGKMISFKYESVLPELKDILITVNYELYDGLPLMIKWVLMENASHRKFKLNRMTNEVLALVEEESAVVGSAAEMKKQHGIYVETNYAFNNAMRYDISDQTTHWKADSVYSSQVNYNYQTPCLLEVYPEKAPGVVLEPGETFKSVRTCELLMDSYDRERRGLAIRKMYRTIAPWTTQNPIFMHLVSKNDDEVKIAIDQCFATGYEALILSFGSHCDMEDTSRSNLQRWKRLADYAHSKGVLIGSYSLFSSRKIGEDDDVLDPLTGKTGGAFFGNAPCFGSKWGLGYRDKMKIFFGATGFNIWENDGPYPGDVCASRLHPGHHGLEDSQWRQMEIQKELYHWLNERGIYINAPDWYFLDGTNKTGIGYREVNFSLPRAQQKILNRQNIYDGTWEKIPSMGWGFVPLTKYQGGDAEAVLEPLHEHRKDYAQLMFQYYGAGVQACYRGPRLYDTDSTWGVVKNAITWYKKYRDILNEDIIHLRRADGRDWDGIMHVSTSLNSRALFLLFNSTNEKIVRTIKLPLYYSGLTSSATIREQEGKKIRYKIDRNYEMDFTFSLEPDSYSWFVVEE